MTNVNANEAAIEAEIQAKNLNAPRLSPAYIDSCIVNKEFTVTTGGRLMVCSLTLANGFIVIGESSVVSAANFNQELGEKISFTKARERIWELEAYLMYQRRYEQSLKGSSELPKVGMLAHMTHSADLGTPEPNIAWSDYLAMLNIIAKVCNETNIAYCKAISDPIPATWDQLDANAKRNYASGVNLHIQNPQAGPQAAHESWMAAKLKDGWVYGTSKDNELKTHPNLVPFKELPASQQAKDSIFREVALQMFATLTKLTK